MPNLRNYSRTPLAVTASALMLTLSACSGESASSGTGETSEAVVSASVEAVEAAYAANEMLPPSDGPEALEDVSLLYLTAGLSSASGTAGVTAAQDAADLLGWDISVFDGQFAPERYQEGLRQAIAQDVDAVLMHGIDCAGNEAPLRALRDQGISVVAIAGVDCDEAGGTGEGLFETPAFPEADSVYEYFTQLGAIQADWIIAKSGGQAEVIEFAVPEFLTTRATQEGFEGRLADCGGCAIVEKIELGVNDFGPGIQDRAQQALLRNPNANYISVSYDELVSYGINTAVNSSGRNESVDVIAGNGYPFNMDLIRNDQGQDAGFAYDFGWDHFAGFDTVNRVLQDQEPGAVGPPVVLFDREHNMPPEGSGYLSGADYRAVFEESWGV